MLKIVLFCLFAYEFCLRGVQFPKFSAYKRVIWGIIP